MIPRAIVSVHDVMPETLPETREILDLLTRHGVADATLLVVPGRDWPAESIRALREWEVAGFRLAGHGWIHRAGERRTLYHRLHGAILSRDQAEHLSRGRDALCRLIRRCHDWFLAAGLRTPDLYVPPAWALGRLTPADLRALPFRRYETLTGYIDAPSGRRHAVPLVGYQADTRMRAGALRANNALNLGLARALRRPVRISIHPEDLGGYIIGDLDRLLARPWQWIHEGALFERVDRGPRFTFS